MRVLRGPLLDGLIVAALVAGDFAFAAPLAPVGITRSGADGAFEVILRGAGEYY